RQNHACDRRMAQCAFLGMKLRGRDQLLAQVGGGVDQEPMLAVTAHGNRGLRALELGMLAARLPAHLATAIPLRYAAAGGCAQDDDAKHDPSPENENAKTEAQIPRRWTPPHRCPSSGHAGKEVHLRRDT